MGNDHYTTSDDRMSIHRGSGYAFDGLPKLNNGNNGGGTKSQASTASSSATRDSGISVTDAQRAADEQRCMYLYVLLHIKVHSDGPCIMNGYDFIIYKTI